ncbi:MAG: RNA polymerase sigma factor [Bacteroidetes bacterium]|nr:RNA polymerase sigma factor [Bacteroidota bacterium]
MNFEEIYREHKNLVYNLALQYTQNTQDAEEVAQDVFLKVYEKFGQFKEAAALKTWIYRITVNQSLDYIKAKKRKKRWSLFTAKSIESDDHSSIPDFNHPGVELENKEEVERLFSLINELPENQKTALILLKIEGLSQVEAAEILETSPKAVESLFQRAKKNLAEKLRQSEGK